MIGGEFLYGREREKLLEGEQQRTLVHHAGNEHARTQVNHEVSILAICHGLPSLTFS